MVVSIGVYLIEDEQLVRDAVGTYLDNEVGLSVAGSASGPVEAIVDLSSSAPDVVVIDLDLGRSTDGLEAARDVRELHPEIRVVILGGEDGDECVVDAVRAGAAAYLTKDATLTELSDAVRRVHAGEVLIPGRYVTEAVGGPGGYVRLSTRERQMLALITDGLTNKQIATRLGLAEQTVKNHVSSMLTKIGVKSRTEAVVRVMRNGYSP